MSGVELAALRTAQGEAALAAAAEVAGGDQLAAAAALRSRGIDPALAAAALTQLALRAHAAGKFGADADLMWLTRAGLEQATRGRVAARRAARLAAAGATHVADLGCGIGSDTIAFARAGLRVSAVDADPATAEVAAANVEALGLADRVTVACGRAEDVDLSAVDAAFCDPARRRAAGRVFDPDAYSPPWSFVTSLIGAVPATVLKVAPGLDHALVPPGAEAEWVSADGDVVEAALWCGPLARAAHRATLLGTTPHGAVEVELIGSGKAVAGIGPIGRYVYDPDGAVVRAHLVAELADRIGGRIADPSIAYVYTDAPAPTPFARGYEIRDVLSTSVKRLRAYLREHGVGRLTIKKRGSPLVPETLRRDLKLAGPHEATLVLTRVADVPTALVCDAL